MPGTTTPAQQQSLMMIDNPQRQTQVTFTSMQNNYPFSKIDESQVNQQQQHFSQSNPAANLRRSESNLDYLFGMSLSNRSPAPNETKSLAMKGAGSNCLDYSTQLSRDKITYESMPIVASKSYRYLCCNCSNPISRLYLVDFNLRQEKAFHLNQIQELFNASENNSIRCPYCQEPVHLVLNTQLIVGNLDQMEQYDYINGTALQLMLINRLTQENASGGDMMMISNQASQVTLKNNALQNANSGVANISPEQQQQQTRDQDQQPFGVSLPVGQIGGVQLLADESFSYKRNNSQVMTTSQAKGVQTRNNALVVIRHKLQKLKDPKKYAQMLLLGEPQTLLQSSSLTNNISGNTGGVKNLKSGQNFNTFITKATTTQQESEDFQHQLNAGLQSQSMLHIDPQNPHIVASRYIPPDSLQKPDRSQCNQYNRDLVRELIERKMRKNKSFLELKIISNPNRDSPVDPRMGIQPSQHLQQHPKMVIHQSAQQPIGAREGNLIFQKQLPKWEE